MLLSLKLTKLRVLGFLLVRLIPPCVQTAGRWGEFWGALFFLKSRIPHKAKMNTLKPKNVRFCSKWSSKKLEEVYQKKTQKTPLGPISMLSVVPLSHMPGKIQSFRDPSGQHWAQGSARNQPRYVRFLNSLDYFDILKSSWLYLFRRYLNQQGSKQISKYQAKNNRKNFHNHLWRECPQNYGTANIIK